MKKITFFTILLFSFSILQSQTADEKIKGLINQMDIFELDQQYPLLKDSMQNDMLRVVSEAWLAHYFNQPETACALFEKLNTDYKEQMGQNILGSTLMWVEDLMRLRKEKQAAEILQEIYQQLPPESDIAAYFQALRSKALFFADVPKSKIVRPDKSTVVPFFEKERKVEGFKYLNGKINGKDVSFMFDTGASPACLVSERIAREHNIRIITDSISVIGIHTEQSAQLGIADNIQIGDITYHNVLFIINPALPNDSIFEFNAVLGSSFLDEMGEFQIDNKNSQIVFPVHNSELPVTGRNLIRNKDKPYLKASSKNEPLTFLFDTGSSQSSLSENYYHKHKEDIEAIGMKDQLLSVGVGGAENVSIYRLPVLTIEVCSIPLELKQIGVKTSPTSNEDNSDGAFGIDIISVFDKVIVNYNKMFVKIE